MAVLDKYVNTIAEAGEKPFPSVNVVGAPVISMACTFETAAADDDGSVYRLFKSLPVNLVPIKIEINNDAITAGTDWDLGFYSPEKGTVIDKDSLVDGADLSSAHAVGSELSGMTALDQSYIGKTIEEIIQGKLSNTTNYNTVDLCLTANTVGSTASTVSVRAIFAQG